MDAQDFETRRVPRDAAIPCWFAVRYLVLPGPWSVDAMRGRTRAPAR